MNFNSVEFDRIKSEAGYNSFTLSPKKWVEKTGAIGIISKGGRYGGAFAHTDIAFEFASAVKKYLDKKGTINKIASQYKIDVSTL